MKLWQKTNDVNKAVERFTVGRDREMDLYLAEADVLGSLAHTRMLESVGLLSSEDLVLVQRELKNVYREIQAGKFTIEDGVEDVHSQVEFMLTQRIGDAGKKFTAAVRATIRCWSISGSSCVIRSRISFPIRWSSSSCYSGSRSSIRRC